MPPRAKSQASQLEQPHAPPYGPSLIVNPEDQAYLDSLPGVEREMILSERYETYSRYSEQIALLEKINSTKPSKRARISEVLSESESEDDLSLPEVRTRKFSESEFIARSEPVPYEAPAPVLSPDVLQSMTVPRDLAIKLLKLPIEMRDPVLRGSLVRLSEEEGTYALSEVLSCKGSDALLIRLVSGRVVSLPVASVSSRAPSSEEAAVFASAVGPARETLLAAGAARKAAELRDARSFEWSEAAVSRVASAPVNKSFELTKLRTDLQISKSSGDGRAPAIELQIRDLEISWQQDLAKVHSRAGGLAAINLRNKDDQRILDEVAGRRRSRADEPGEGRNPFKRRECTPAVMWDTGKKPVDKPKSPKKEMSPKPEQVKRAKYSAVEELTKHNLCDLIDVPALLARAGSTDTRYSVFMRGAAVDEPRELSGLWAAARQRRGAGIGEIMEFDEWKRRVAAQGNE